MKWPLLSLSVILPGALGWWAGRQFLPAEHPSSQLAAAVMKELAPALLDVLKLKSGTTETRRQRMAGLARLGMDDARALAAALRGDGVESADARRDASRALALESPAACWDFITAVWPDDAVNQRAFCEDAAVYAYERDPAAGLAFLEKLNTAPPGGLGSEAAVPLAAKALAGFPRKDLPFLRAWVDKQPVGPLRDNIATNILPRLAQEDYPAALVLARRMVDENKTQAFLATLTGPELPVAEREARLTQLTDAERQSILPDLIKYYNWGSFESSIQQIQALSSEARQSTATELFSGWAGRDPLRAAHSIGTLPEDLQSEAAAGVAGQWATLNQAAASGWVASLPPGENREAAARKLSTALASTHPQEALTWAASLTDAGSRQSTLRDVWKTALAKNPEAARKALEA